MTRLLLLASTLLVAACGDSTPTDTVESLLVNPERLRELREQCRLNRSELCDTVSEATRKAFMGDGEVPYTSPEERPAF